MSRSNPAQDATRGSAHRRAGFAIDIAALPVPMALVADDGSIADANDGFRAELPHFDTDPQPLRDVLKRLVFEASRRGRARTVFESGDETLSLEAGERLRDLQLTPVAAARTGAGSGYPDGADFRWGCDAQGVITAMSVDAVRALDQVPTAFVGRTLGSVFALEDYGQPGEAVVADPAKAEPFRNQRPFRDLCVRLRTSDGSERWLDLSATPVYSGDGTFLGYRGAARDATVRRRNELARTEAERRRQRAERDLLRLNGELRLALEESAKTERLRSNLIANFNHELRTPLTAMVAAGEMLSLGYYGAISEAAQAAGHRVVSAGRHLKNLLDELVEISAIHSGTVELQSSVVDIATILQEEIDAAAASAARKGVVPVGFDSLPHIEAFVDATASRRVLRALLDHAIARTPAGKKVGLQVACAGEADSTSISIWDQGEGYSPEAARNVFEPLSQGNVAADHAASGPVGSGLSIARAYARLQGGDVELTKSGKHGSRFTFRFPRHEG